MHQLRLATAAMGTRFELVLFTAEPARHGAAAEAAIEEIEAAHRRYTRFAPDSLVSHINRTAAHTPVRLDADTFAMLEDALRVERASRRAFSITPTPPPPPQPSPRPAYALDPEDRSITLPHREASIDLGAIAKGHALDLAAALLRAHGVTSALLHGGTSSVIAIGAPPGEDGWRIALGPEPDAPAVTLRDAALSVSATTERSHIIDPRTGAPAPANRRAAVIGPSARLADAWSTALLVLGERPRALGAEWVTFIELGSPASKQPPRHGRPREGFTTENTEDTEGLRGAAMVRGGSESSSRTPGSCLGVGPPREDPPSNASHPVKAASSREAAHAVKRIPPRQSSPAPNQTTTHGTVPRRQARSTPETRAPAVLRVLRDSVVKNLFGRCPAANSAARAGNPAEP